MTDNITLPRKHIDYAVHALEHFNKDAPNQLVFEIVHHLRAALAAPRLEVTVDPRLTPDEAAAISSALAAPRPEPSGYAYRYADNVLRFNDGGWLSGWPPVEAVPYWFAPPAAAPEPVRHPGYLIGNHWLETAYSRVCAGEAEAEVLKDCGWERVDDVEALRRDAERYWRLRDKAPPDIGDMASVRDSHDPSEIDAAIDAAMEPATKPAIRARGEVPR